MAAIVAARNLVHKHDTPVNALCKVEQEALIVLPRYHVELHPWITAAFKARLDLAKRLGCGIYRLRKLHALLYHGTRLLDSLGESQQALECKWADRVEGCQNAPVQREEGRDVVIVLSSYLAMYYALMRV